MKGFIIVFCFITNLTIGQPSNCNLKKQTDGIKVYTCKTEYERLKTLKAEFIVKNTSLSALRDFLLRVDNYPTWQYNMMNAELLQIISEDEITYRSEINAPWPIEDREMMMNFKVTEDAANQQMYIEMRAFESTQPVKEDFIRVPFMHGQWNVISTKNNTLEVEYILRIDPGGSVPAWLVNLAMAEGPYISFRNLKRQLEK